MKRSLLVVTAGVLLAPMVAQTQTKFTARAVVDAERNAPNAPGTNSTRALPLEVCSTYAALQRADGQRNVILTVGPWPPGHAFKLRLTSTKSIGSPWIINSSGQINADGAFELRTSNTADLCAFRFVVE